MKLLKRTFFDKMIIGILLLIIVSFIFVASYMVKASREVLAHQKQDNITNEAKLLCTQTMGYYFSGQIGKEELQKRFDEFKDCLNTEIWFYDVQGKLVVASHNSNTVKKIPKNIFDCAQSIELETGFMRQDNFYGYFENDMISAVAPVNINGGGTQGYVVLHVPFTEGEGMENKMMQIVYFPLFTMILIVVISLTYFSSTVLRPIAKISQTAREYAKGNFEEKTGVSRDDEIGELAESLENMAGELSKLDEYRKEFIANISHDFRSPLTSIKGYLEAMLDGTIPVDKYDRYLNIVLTESQRLTKLTSGLLELNDFDTFGPVLKKSSFDIVQVAQEVRNTFEGRCAEKKIDIQLDCPKEGAVVYADRMKIGQVVYNLVDNAIKFSPKGGTIYVSILEKGERVFVSVRDEGPGIEKDKQNKVFDRFYKTDPSRGKDKQGTGLGLAITKEIIRAHGENIDLVSTEGIGTKFLFTLRTKENA